LIFFSDSASEVLGNRSNACC